MDILKNFFEESTMVTIIVLLWLSAYFLITLWIYIYKSFVLSEWLTSEKYQLDMLLTQSISVSKNAFINTLLEKRNGEISKEILQVWKFKATQKATSFLVVLNVIASTAPFIGLFGTVVEILETFRVLGGGNVSFDIIAPVISKALVATAAGILVAIPAYSFALLLKRKAYHIINCIQMQIDLMLSNK
ncbi:MotA/TolQ/ExbB proton channel family protein [Helicobacter marmotae]|uniref:MotA/TolQ/ExbB proton channel family protein n=1 Tax=Helicobacter marmotae TaxID=152490 RepID=A0A3D8I4R2_9HELI|nr:MotA/TolQ/ExbB proton channel family protein [Helicobacter marmotae]RDU60143.1 MotA/TolQ/ExbB proton channel family protein [Helicobacter marmotae]